MHHLTIILHIELFRHWPLIQIIGPMSLHNTLRVNCPFMEWATRPNRPREVITTKDNTHTINTQIFFYLYLWPHPLKRGGGFKQCLPFTQEYKWLSRPTGPSGVIICSGQGFYMERANGLERNVQKVGRIVWSLFPRYIQRINWDVHVYIYICVHKVYM